MDYKAADRHDCPSPSALVVLGDVRAAVPDDRLIVVPIKALVMNVLSLGATFGALVWVFQDGH